MKVVLFCGGLGMRLREYSESIPKPMIKHAQLEKDIVVVGLGNRVEMWNATLYEDYLIKDQEEFSKLAQKYLKE